MRLSCSESAFPALAPAARLQLVRALGFEWVDVALFLDSDREIADFLRDPLSTAGARDVGAHDLRAADLFLILRGGAFTPGAINARDETWRALARRVFESALACAVAARIPGMTLLPGTPWPGRDRAGWRLCVEELTWRVRQAEPCGIALRIEPHLGSIVSTPELALDLLDAVPGLTLTLDASHFIVQSIDMARILPLAAHASHVHVRAARPGQIQLDWGRNETNFAPLLDALASAGFEAALCIEYVPMAQWQCDRMDVLSAVAETRTAFEQLMATRPASRESREPEGHGTRMTPRLG